ncbi:MAG TPA: hypothetical protein VK659_04980 [Asanoa sp.]|nr:hypothetical protein [Asanoa sp.]
MPHDLRPRRRPLAQPFHGERICRHRRRRLEFDWEIRAGTTDREQAVFIELGTVDYDEPIAEDGVVDRSLYLEAVGAG